MAAQQLPDQMGDFARYLSTVTERLDPESGWCAVFRRRDPDGLTACLRGAEVPPWDVVESLLQDLAADGEETAHARGLHAAAATAHDRRPGGAEALRRRLEAMRRERARAAERGRELLHRLAAVPEHSAAYRDLAHDLSWTNDDHTRATSRCAELATRIAALAPPPGPPAGRAPSGPHPDQPHRAAAAAGFGAHTAGPDGDHDAHRGAAPGVAGGEPAARAGQGHHPAHFGAETRTEPPEAGAEETGGGRRAAARAGGSGPGWDGVAAATGGAGGAGVWPRAEADAEETGGGRRAAAAGGVGPGRDGAPAAADGAGGAGAWGAADGGAGPEWGGADAGFGAAGVPNRPAGDAEVGPGRGGAPAAADGAGAWRADVASGGGAPQPPGADSPGGAMPGAGSPGSGPPGAGREERRGSRRRPRGARYAWFDGAAEDGGDEPVPVPGVPELPVAAARPRGARFVGGADAEPAGAVGRPPAAPVGEDDRRAALEAVAALGRLRAEGRSGEAHVLLCEAASGPAARLPVLAAELHRSGLSADWPTLLWEVASLPPERLAEAAGALAEAGREDDCGRLLRQGVSRPAGEIADAVLALADAGGRREAGALLAAFLRVRTPEEGARIAAADPRRLVPQLLSAARAVSPGSERDLVHALRVAGLIGA